ncbi:hypothetical protein [Corynebacterium spheniscorum]|uniref:Uncharacterized protein n=1 Tax=Corynebacterium spheniscorum TaxID=185761 RepID=A0A1I2QHR0_9CORY|nr:hypothetical protein [Corynebacterium spheniscorum]KAA8719362.1 hypothetical protein F4V56_10085 [Corynebacterium spheniscorum]SFG28115.1 hypothetical protein SAMN05660282_00471 [Corynebacterium spheniscorum]
MAFTDLGWWTAERLVAAANLGLFILAVFTAAAALIAIHQTKKIIKQNEEAQTEAAMATLKSQNQQEEYNRLAAKSVKLQAESVERTNRPMMTARYLPPQHEASFLDIEIDNAGRSIAHDVQVKFDPPLPQPNLEKLNKNCKNGDYYVPLVELTQRAFEGRVFQTWVPGQKITAPLWVDHKDYIFGDPAGFSAEGVPASQLVHISYKDAIGKEYQDSFALDPGIWAGKLFPQSEMNKQRKVLKQMAGYLSGIEEQVKLFVNRTTSASQKELEREEKKQRIIENDRRRREMFNE